MQKNKHDNTRGAFKKKLKRYRSVRLVTGKNGNIII